MERFVSLSALVLGLPYLFGYSYLSGYFAYYEITMGEAQMSQSEIYVGAFHALRAWLITIDPKLLDTSIPARVGAFAALVLLTAWTFRRARLVREEYTEPGLWAFLGAWCVGLFVVSNLGTQQGQAVALADRDRLPMSYIFPIGAETAAPSIVEGTRLWGGDKRIFPKLIHATSDTAFLLMQGATKGGEPWVMRLPVDADRIVATIRKD